MVNLRDKAKARRGRRLICGRGVHKAGNISRMMWRAYISQKALENREDNKKWLVGFKFEMVTDEVMHYMADTKTPQGVLAVAKQKKMYHGRYFKEDKHAELDHDPENIQDPGNLGTIIRAGEGAGITGVVREQ